MASKFMPYSPLMNCAGSTEVVTTVSSCSTRFDCSSWIVRYSVESSFAVLSIVRTSASIVVSSAAMVEQLLSSSWKNLAVSFDPSRSSAS